MLRSEVITGINALRYIIARNKVNIESEEDLAYFEEVLTEARRAIYLNEMNDPYSK